MIYFALFALLLTPGAQALDSEQFLTAIPTEGKPIALAAATSFLYVIDRGKNLLYIYDTSSGQKIKSVGNQHKTAGVSFSSPRGVAVAMDGRVYVADTGNNRIVVMDSQGNLIKAFGRSGSERGSFSSPRSVDVGRDGRVYVADTKNNRVEVFTGDGLFLYQFGSTGEEGGQFRLPTKLMVAPSDSVYVLDTGYHRHWGLFEWLIAPGLLAGWIPTHTNRLEQFNPTTSFTEALPLPGNGFEMNPLRVFAPNHFPPADDFLIDSYGFIYVLNWRQGKVIEESPNGSVLGEFGEFGSGKNQFNYPEAIALSPDGESLWIADTENNRIQHVAISEHLKTAPLPLNPKTKITVSGPAAEWPINASLITANGNDLYAYVPKKGKFIILDQNGQESGRFGSEGKGASQTRKFGGIVASEKLGIFAADMGGDRLQRFDSRGAWKANFAEAKGFFSFTKKGKDGYVRKPQGLAINEGQKIIYVADTGNRRLEAFNPDGSFVFKVGPHFGSYDLQNPMAVVWSSQESSLYFLDHDLHKVFKCGPEGNFITQWGSNGDVAGQFQSAVSMTSDGERIYVLDETLARISIFDKDGNWVSDAFSPGNGPDQLLDPVSMTLRGMRLEIADKGKGKILSFQIHALIAPPASLSPSAAKGIVSLSWPAAADPWAATYHIYRSSVIGGPYAEIGRSDTVHFDDSSLNPSTTYFYRIATQSKTQDVGEMGLPAIVTLPTQPKPAPQAALSTAASVATAAPSVPTPKTAAPTATVSSTTAFDPPIGTATVKHAVRRKKKVRRPPAEE